MKVVLKDHNGFPVLTDNEELLLGVAKDNRPPPGLGAPFIGTRSGNAFHDPRSGKFGFAPPGSAVKAGGGHLRSLSTQGRKIVHQRSASVKANGIAAFPSDTGIKVVFMKNGRQVDSMIIPKEHVGNQMQLQVAGTPEELRRRNDAVRDAAREFDDFNEGDAREFLNGRTTRSLTESEIEHFIHDVREHRVHDMVDILDQRLRKKGLGARLRSRRIVTVNAPKGFMRKSLNGLMDEEVIDIANRLRAKGWTEDDLSQELVKRFSAKRQPIIAGLVGTDL